MYKGQIVTGAGLGLTLQGPNIAAQTVLSKQEVSVGLSIISLGNFLGSSIFVTVAQALLQNRLVSKLQTLLPDVDLSNIAKSGVTSIRDNTSAAQLSKVLDAYNDALRDVWYLALGLSCLTLLASFGMEWKNVKAKSAIVDGERNEEAGSTRMVGISTRHKKDDERSR
jgi:hypothetical protein